MFSKKWHHCVHQGMLRGCCPAKFLPPKQLRMLENLPGAGEGWTRPHAGETWTCPREGHSLPLQVTPCCIPAPEGNFQGGRMNSEVSLSQLRARQKPRLSSGTNHSRVLVALPQLGRNQSSGADPRAQRHSGLSAPPCCGREPLWSRLEGSGPAGQVQHIPGGAGSCGRGDPRGSPR